MLRFLSLFGFSGLFLLISPELRATVLFGLGRVTLELAKYSPYSYIVLALAIGVGAVKSMATPKPQ